MTGIATGTTVVTYQNSYGCLRTIVATVNTAVEPITGPALVCAGQTNALLVSPSSGGTWSSNSTSVVTAHASTGLLSGISSGSANITYKASPGCYTIIIATVNASVASITGATGFCAAGGTTTLANTTGGGDWSSSNTSRATINPGTRIVTGATAGTATITYLVTAACYKTVVVTVNPLPSAISGATTVADGSTVTFTSSAGSGVWSGSNNSIATVGTGNGVVTGVGTGVATISYHSGTGCFVTRDINVVASRPADFNLAENITFSVYPNPTSGSITVNSSVNGVFMLFAADGRTVTQYTVNAGATPISLPGDLAEGLYLGRFDGANNTSATARVWFKP
jgi:hypothetical protein